MLHTRVMPSADCYTDHKPARCKVAFTFKSPPRRKGPQTKTLPFADDCDPLAYTEEALQHIINRFSDATKNLGFAISLKKTY